MADLTRNITVAPEALSPDGPEPLTGAGDLVAIIGLGDDPLRVARRMVEAVGDTAIRRSEPPATSLWRAWATSMTAAPFWPHELQGSKAITALLWRLG